ncbi:MAG: FtsW/RodA/SpoVE family cell cycle protein, partial [Clostridium perfringens]|nr:FtsW/RodA/SpoVE family cell cycle protein [Clostridium perfringens]
MEEKISQGKSEKIAIEEANAQMGDYTVVGGKLNKVHKATTDLILLPMMAALILISVITLFNMRDM